ncbi:MAG: hypothetical protein Q4C95_08310 [Planctomycetia bacterium]|nr:hypothetical protein [Planctomycetia bacterium]
MTKSRFRLPKPSFFYNQRSESNRRFSGKESQEMPCFAFLCELLLFFFLFCFLTTEKMEAQSQVTKKVFFWNINKTEQNLIKSDAYRQYEEGFSRLENDIFLCDNGSNVSGQRGVSQSIVLNQQTAKPFIASAWSKAENVSGSADNNYAIYIDIIFQDGTPLWGQYIPFSTGTHDWEYQEITVFPSKPIKSLTFYTLFRNHSGKAFFKDFQFNVPELSDNFFLFDSVPVLSSSIRVQSDRLLLNDLDSNQNLRTLSSENESVFSKLRHSLQIRNVAQNSDFINLNDAFSEKGASAFDVTVRSTFSKESQSNETQDSLILQTIELENQSDQDRALTLVYSIQPNHSESTGFVWFDDPRRTSPIEKDQEYVNAQSVAAGSSGRLSIYPFGMIGVPNPQTQSPELLTGIALGIAPESPVFYRVGYHETSNELYLACDIALTKEMPYAKLQFVILGVPEIRNDNGFRKALQCYYDHFPESFDRRISEQGNWMPFAKISAVPDWEDFGFKFKEGNDETDWDDAHGILTFRYTEPMTYWMPMPKETPKTLEAALNYAQMLATNGNPSAQAFLTSGHFDAQGNYCGIMLDTPWCDGTVWSMNDMPGLSKLIEQKQLTHSDQYPLAGIDLKWNQTIADQLYGKPVSTPFLTDDPEKTDSSNSFPGIDGEYIDSSEGYVTAVLNYRREHFSAVQTPLVFDQKTFAPAIYRGLIAFEYARQLSDDVHARHRYMMANSTPGQFFWLVPQLDVLGTETNWNINGHWQPMKDAEMIYRRAICRYKPYCFLMNTNFEEFSYEASEKFMKRSLAYGMFPGFFSADASTGHYFTRPELYNRDRPLFKKYLPLCKLVAEAGWEPITSATVNDQSIIIERFGAFDKNSLFTVFNDSNVSKEIVIIFNNDAQDDFCHKIQQATQNNQNVPKTFWQILQKDSNLTMKNLVNNETISLNDGKLIFSLEPQDVAVLTLE